MGFRCNDYFLIISSLILGIVTFIFICIGFGKSVGMNKLEENNPDRDINSISSFSFKDFTPEDYSPNLPNLGTTGRLVYDCYTGTCSEYVEKTCSKKVCEKIGNETQCHYEYYDCSYYHHYPYYSCSLDCRRTEISYCSKCPIRSSYDSNRGTCEFKKKDTYSASKSCHADNLILKWKALSYERTNSKIYTYIKNVVSENEECPNNMKLCGFINSYKDKLCIDETEECPINSIIKSENPPINENDYNKVKLNDDTVFYYSNKNYINGTIVESLYADSDLLIKYDTDCEIIDTNTIKAFINDNKKLYTDLGYDPYNIDNIDNRGKSYLKWCSPLHGKDVSISYIREIYEVYVYNISINEEVNKAEEYYSSVFKPCFITQIVGICLLFIIIFLSFIFADNESDEKNTRVIILFYSIFFITSILTFIFSIVNVSKLEKRIDETVYSLNKSKIYSFKVFNFINLFGNALMILIYLLLTINCILECFSTSLCEVVLNLIVCIGLLFSSCIKYLSSLCVKKEDNFNSKSVSNTPMIPKQETNNPNIEFRTLDEINGGFTYN